MQTEIQRSKLRLVAHMSKDQSALAQEPHCCCNFKNHFQTGTPKEYTRIQSKIVDFICSQNMGSIFEMFWEVKQQCGFWCIWE